MNDAQNPVWETLSGIATKALDYARDVNVARASRPQSAAAPSGSPTSQVFNPFPGLFGSYPQAEGKPQPGALSFNLQMLSPILIIGGILLLVFALARR